MLYSELSRKFRERFEDNLPSLFWAKEEEQCFFIFTVIYYQNILNGYSRPSF